MPAEPGQGPEVPRYRPPSPLEVWREGDGNRIDPKDFVALERTRLLETHRTQRGAMTQVFVLGLSAIIASVIFGVLGVVLVFLAGDDASSTVEMLGQTIGTDSVGVACIFIGAVAFVFSLRAVLRTMGVMIEKND